MTVNELIAELEQLKLQGYKDLEVCVDIGLPAKPDIDKITYTELALYGYQSHYQHKSDTPYILLGRG